MTLATPETLARIVNNPKYARYRTDHEANAGHPLVRGCTIGRVFSFKGADYVYVGVKAGNTTYPCIGVDLDSRKTMKFTADVFRRVRAGV